MKKYIVTTLLTLILGGMSAAQEESSVHVWGTCVSPYVRKVVSVLEEKKIDYEVHPILPKILLEARGEKIPVEFEKISPLGKIPAIQVGSFGISDSSVIVAYLEKKWPQNSVYPANTEDFARALWYENYADGVMTDVIHKIFIERVIKPNEFKVPADEQVVASLAQQLPGILRFLETELTKNQSKYLVGDRLTIADIAVIQHFVSLRHSKMELSAREYPLLSQYVERVLAHPSIKVAIEKA